MNPLLPRTFFMADAEAHVFPDGRLYLVGSTDISGSKDYCSTGYHVWSTADPGLKSWTDHGEIFSNSPEAPSVPRSPGVTLYAPDMAYKGGKYYLYVCGADGFEAVASAGRPEGPYGDVRRINIADGDGIDPTVFVDDDGSAYYLWGQFHLRGGRLRDNMYEIEPDSVRDNILTEQEHGFHEGASLRKINGRYYIIYTDISRGKATCMSYAVADSPLGPYKKGGVIIDNTYCDPMTWNNHGSVQQYRGQWFVFYHRATQNGVTCRRVCAEPITVLPDGTIPEVPMTTNGAEPPICAYRETDAAAASRLKGNLYVTPDPEALSGEILTDCGGGNWLEAWAEYKYLDFGSEEAGGAARCVFTASGSGRITVMTEGLGRVGSVCLREDGDDASADHSPKNRFRTFSADLSIPVCGIRAVWLLFDGGKTDLASFRFERRI